MQRGREGEGAREIGEERGREDKREGEKRGWMGQGKRGGDRVSLAAVRVRGEGGWGRGREEGEGTG